MFDRRYHVIRGQAAYALPPAASTSDFNSTCLATSFSTNFRCNQAFETISEIREPMDVNNSMSKEGEPVNVGEVLVELETDRVNLEVGAKSAGVLAKIEVPEGGDVKVGEVLGTIDEHGKQPEAASQKEAPKTEKVEEKKRESIRNDGHEQPNAPQLKHAKRISAVECGNSWG